MRRLWGEALELRLTLSTVQIALAGNVLTLTGDSDSNSALVNDDVSIAYSAANNSFTITGHSGTTLTASGVGTPLSPSQVRVPRTDNDSFTISSIRVALGAGNDSLGIGVLPVVVEVRGGGHLATPTTGVRDGRDPASTSSFVPGVIQVPIGDLLAIDDSALTQSNAQYTISGTQVTRSGLPLVTFPDADIERLTLTTGPGNNDVTADMSAGSLPPIVQILAGSGDSSLADNRFQVEGSSGNDNISIQDFVEPNGSVEVSNNGSNPLIVFLDPPSGFTPSANQAAVVAAGGLVIPPDGAATFSNVRGGAHTVLAAFANAQGGSLGALYANQNVVVATGATTKIAMIETGGGSSVPGSAATGPFTVTYDTNAQNLAAGLISRPLPSGVTIAGATYAGSAVSAGTFVNGDAVPLGILPQGVLLSSGDAKVPASNTTGNFGASVAQPGDADLTALANIGNAGAAVATFDAAALTLTIEVAANSGIQSGAFNFQFGSEEYREYVGSEFNDVVGAFINGGAATNAMRDSLGRGVSVNSVFFDEPNEAGEYKIEYDGLTSALVARFPLRPGTNTLKIAIADASDDVFDSAVLLTDLRFSTLAVGQGGTIRASDLNSHFELAGFQRLWARGNGGNDVLDNTSRVPGLLAGGDGDDVLNSVVDDPSSQLVINPARVIESSIHNVSLVLGEAGSDQHFAGSSSAPDTAISFLIGDYLPSGRQADGTYTAFAQALAGGDSYASSSADKRQGYVTSGSDSPAVGSFKYAGSNINFLFTSAPGSGHYIYPAAYNPLVQQLKAYTKPVALATGTDSTIILPPKFAAALDVSQDGALSAGDALAIINDLNASGSRPVAAGGEGEPSLAANGADPLLDVNGDQYVTAADALAVINALNALSRSTSPAEGEAAPGLGDNAEDAAGMLAADELLGLLAADWDASGRKRSRG